MGFRDEPKIKEKIILHDVIYFKQQVLKRDRKTYIGGDRNGD
jgi:hypothetical protein